MRTATHIVLTLAVMGLAMGSALAAFDSEGIFVHEQSTESLKAKHAWKTSGGGGDGKTDFAPDVAVYPDEFGAEITGIVTTSEQGSSTEEFFLVVHAGKGSRDRPTNYRAKIGSRDGVLGDSFSAVLSDLVYALDRSLPQSAEVLLKSANEAIDGAVDVTSSKALLDLRDRGGDRVDVKLKAKYKGTVIFGPRAGKRVKGSIVLVAKSAPRGT